jgi:nicotinamide mononucleotide (NMN) deamidase PncC
LPVGVDVYSSECAKHLAISSKAKAGTSYGIGVTGKAEPQNGIVRFAIAKPSGETNWTVREYKGDRNEIRAKVAMDVIEMFKVLLLPEL